MRNSMDTNRKEVTSQFAEFRSYEGQVMYVGEKIVPIKLDLCVNHTLVKDQFLWDLNNFESDHEEFAKISTRTRALNIPRLEKIAIQSVVSARETRMSNKGRRGAEYTPVRKRKEWDVYEPIVDLLSNEEVDAIEAKEERNFW
ncbi:hypothetical protein GYH30_025195 [Glycine max]|nr:hypothetical protein GYH30_025195 [Glycine max]